MKIIIIIRCTHRKPSRTETGGKTAAACRAPRGPEGLGGRTAAPTGSRTRRERSHSPGSSQLPGPTPGSGTLRCSPLKMY